MADNDLSGKGNTMIANSNDLFGTGGSDDNKGEMPAGLEEFLKALMGGGKTPPSVVLSKTIQDFFSMACRYATHPVAAVVAELTSTGGDKKISTRHAHLAGLISNLHKMCDRLAEGTAAAVINAVFNILREGVACDEGLMKAALKADANGLCTHKGEAQSKDSVCMCHKHRTEFMTELNERALKAFRECIDEVSRDISTHNEMIRKEAEKKAASLN